MVDVFGGTVAIKCGECRTEMVLTESYGRGGFLKTGWRFEDSELTGPTFLCTVCANPTGVNSLLTSRKSYLAHIFEAQQRFGE